jgi:hypothetical protein
MSTKQFNYFDDWKKEVLECPKCHWSGMFEQGSVEHYMDQMDCACPKCDVVESPILAVVLWPTLQELRANMDKPGIREWVEQIDRGFDEFEAQKLREPSQLPDIGESHFELVWDFDDSNPNDLRTLIQHGDVVIFSEPARFEEFERFGEVCQILRARYGDAIKDLVPTLRSEHWLYGNDAKAKNFVEWFRAHHFGASPKPLLDSERNAIARNLEFLERAKQRTAEGDSHSQLAMNFDAEPRPSYEQTSDGEVSKAHGAKRPVPGVPGASWEQTEYGTKLTLEPNAEFDALPKEVQDEMLEKILEAFDKPDHISRVTALRDEFANKKTQHSNELATMETRLQFGPELPNIDAEEFAFTFDYSQDGSKYFVLYGEKVILSGQTADDSDDHMTDNVLGGQFIEIAKKLKVRYGAKLVDLVPTPKADSKLMDIWGWALKLERGRKIVQKGLEVSQC